MIDRYFAYIFEGGSEYHVETMPDLYLTVIFPDEIITTGYCTYTLGVL